MRFKQFLLEQVDSNGSSLVLQKILDNVDHGHVDYNDTTIRFNVGKIIKDKSFSNLHLVIRSSDVNDSVRLGRSGDGYAVVVDTTSKLPSREDIDEFISSNKSICSEIKKLINQYTTSYKEGSGEDNPSTNYEDKNHHNSRNGFEEMYKELVNELDKKLEEFKNTSEHVKSQLDSTEDAGRKEMLKLSLKNIAKDTIGDDYNEFTKVTKHCANQIHQNFIRNLDKESKDKLNSRLESYYENKVCPAY